MNIESIWMREYKKKTRNMKSKLADTDILIIGGGITGLSCAYFLKDSKLQITLLDKGKVAMGVSSRTTAKINYLQGTIYQELEKYYGIKKSKLYLDSQIEAIRIIESITKKEKIKCDLEKVDSFLYTNEEKNVPKIKKEMELLKGFDIKVGEVDSLPISEIPILKGIVVSNTYVFHPIKYLLGLLQSIQDTVQIKEDILVQDMQLKEDGTYLISTNEGTFSSKIVVVACHYPFFIKPGFFPFFGYLKREYVQAVKVEIPHHFTAINIDSSLRSIRYYKDYLIYGSREKKLTSSYDYEAEYNKSKEEFFHFFHKEPEYSWMNQDLMMNDSLPWIGILDKKQPNLYIATGYQAWGMTNGTIAGKIIGDLILEKENSYAQLFSPLRSMKPKILPLFTNGFEYLKAYTKTYFDKNPKFHSKHAMILKINGIDCGIFIDKMGKKHIVRNLCPHLKCKLVFNTLEETWDCPCHGSRFNIDGDVIEGPATFSIRIQK